MKFGFTIGFSISYVGIAVLWFWCVWQAWQFNWALGVALVFLWLDGWLIKKRTTRLERRLNLAQGLHKEIEYHRTNI